MCEISSIMMHPCKLRKIWRDIALIIKMYYHYWNLCGIVLHVVLYSIWKKWRIWNKSKNYRSFFNIGKCGWAISVMYSHDVCFLIQFWLFWFDLYVAIIFTQKLNALTRKKCKLNIGSVNNEPTSYWLWDRLTQSRFLNN